MATVFDDQIALAELMGNSFAPVRRFGQARVALAERDLNRAQAQQDRALELARQEEQAIRRESRAQKEVDRQQRKALIALAEEYGIKDITDQTSDADIRTNIQKQAFASAQPIAQEILKVNQEVDQISTIPKAERDKYFASLVLSDPEISAVISKYPDIGTRLAAGTMTLSDAQKQLAQTRDAQAAQKAFLSAVPKYQIAFNDWLAAREEGSRNSPRVKSLLTRGSTLAQAYFDRIKAVVNPAILGQGMAQTRPLTTSESSTDIGLPLPPRALPAPAAQQAQQPQRFQSSIPNTLAPERPIPVDPNFRMDAPVPMEFYAPVNSIPSFRGSMALDPSEAAAWMSPQVRSLLAPGVGGSMMMAPRQAASPITQAEINAVIEARRRSQNPIWRPDPAPMIEYIPMGTDYSQ